MYCAFVVVCRLLFVVGCCVLLHGVVLVGCGRCSVCVVAFVARCVSLVVCCFVVCCLSLFVVGFVLVVVYWLMVVVIS